MRAAQSSLAAPHITQRQAHPHRITSASTGLPLHRYLTNPQLCALLAEQAPVEPAQKLQKGRAPVSHSFPAMSQQPSTPVKVSSTTASYTPATLDPDLRSQINTVLLRDGHITKIQDSLLHSLNANNHNWPSAIQSHALSLLRSGEITTFPALLRKILDDIRKDGLHQAPAGGTTAATNGKAFNGDKVNGTAGAAAAAGGPGLAVPEAVVEEALKVARESLEAVCELDESGS